MKATQPSTTTIGVSESVTSRAFAVLDSFDATHRRQSLSDIARRTGLPLATAHRLVGRLCAWGALTRDADRRYLIGRRIWELGLLAPANTDLREVASPFLHDVYGATLATVHLAVRDDTHALYIDSISGHASVPVLSTSGTRLPLHATGVGKVLLAHAPEPVQAAVLGDLARITPYTVVQPALLRSQLGRVRTEGHAQTNEEMSLGACSVAVPIRRRDNVVAALGIVVPRLRQDRLRLVSALQVAARGIGRKL